MTQNQSRPLFYQQQHPAQHPQQQYLQPAAVLYDRARHTASPFEANKLNALDFDFDFDLDSSNLNYSSLSSSPISTQSLLSQYSPLSAFDSLPTPTLAEPSLFHPVKQSGSAAPESSAPFFPNLDAMQTETWMPNGQLTPRSVGRFSHQRDSSRSSMGSNGPASPFPQNTAHPQIANMNDYGDNFHGLHGNEDLNNYHLATNNVKLFPGLGYDTYQFGSTSGGSGIRMNNGYLAATAPRRRNDQGLIPEHPIGSARSQDASVASSIASDSPATPAGESEEERKRNTAMPPVPKLDRTITDIVEDGLLPRQDWNNITSPSSGQASISPASDLFTQRLQAANNQHLSVVTNSPVSSASRDQSPFRHGSPLAPMPMNDFRFAPRFNTAQQMREQTKAMRDAQAMQQHIARAADTSTPQTISPKDAMLEYSEPEGDANFPLFPQQNNMGFNGDAINKAAAAQSQQVFSGMAMDPNTFNNFLGTSMPATMQPPHQYPFMPQQRPHSAVPSVSNTSAATTRFGSADTGATESVHGINPQRPADTRADGGTYTCTYHGCTLRFDTPAQLQKHKREGHRQAHGLNGPRRPDAPGMTSTLLNTQAGPHKCERINPSTGKPCNTEFSRPYDLTRHEHTIHNARKQKVKCNLCTDDKTFSRADALTRHYRVCHPDVEFPGKQRRRGGHSG